jgi:hypothetical protein
MGIAIKAPMIRITASPFAPVSATTMKVARAIVMLRGRSFLTKRFIN